MNKISICDFSFKKEFYGTYRVTYTSPKTNKSWFCVTFDMQLIDKTKNCEEPKIKDLIALKRICKNTKVNMARVLKKYPKGTKLYSIIHGNVELEEVDKNNVIKLKN